MVLNNVASTPADRVIQPLHPGLRPVVRTDGSVQLGQDPVHGVLLTGLAPDETGAVTRLLRLLAGAASPLRSRILARSCGIPERRVLEIAEMLDHAGLTSASAPILPTGGLAAWSLARLRQGPERTLSTHRVSTVAERRSGARVAIDGRGPLALEIGRLLTTAQVGEVQSGWYAAAAEAHDRTSPDPTLIVAVSTRLPRGRAADWHARGIAHLPVVAGAASVDIGPLIIPGAGPCVSCLARHDGSGVLAQLGVDDPVTDGQGEPVLVEPALAALAAGAIAMLALGHLDSYPPPLGVRWHCALPLPSLAISRWDRHPACDVGPHVPR